MCTCSSGGNDDEGREGRADGEADEGHAFARVEGIRGSCGWPRGRQRRRASHLFLYLHLGGRGGHPVINVSRDPV